ncbi:hypothetical protein Peur_013826 [Populus x canadensis]
MLGSPSGTAGTVAARLPTRPRHWGRVDSRAAAGSSNKQGICNVLFPSVFPRRRWSHRHLQKPKKIHTRQSVQIFSSLFSDLSLFFSVWADLFVSFSFLIPSVSGGCRLLLPSLLCRWWSSVGNCARSAGDAVWGGAASGGQICGHSVPVSERTDSTHAADRPDVWRIGGFTPTSFLHRRCRPWALLGAPVGARVREGRSVAGKEGSDRGAERVVALIFWVFKKGKGSSGWRLWSGCKSR